MLIKLDREEAFDTIEWNFLKNYAKCHIFTKSSPKTHYVLHFLLYLSHIDKWYSSCSLKNMTKL